MCFGEHRAACEMTGVQVAARGSAAAAAPMVWWGLEMGGDRTELERARQETADVVLRTRLPRQEMVAEKGWGAVQGLR